MAEECVCSKCTCQVDQDALIRCPMCFKRVCKDCLHHVNGRSFCSAPCAQFFFFEGDEDDS